MSVDRLITSGTFALDGGSWQVDNNVWLVGSDEEVVVIDAAHDAAAILAAAGGRRITAIVCTHAHNDHINAAAEVAAAAGAPILLHPADQVLWAMQYGPEVPYLPLKDGQVIDAGDVALTVLHTPGHSPGAVCLHARELGVVFSGDTLFQGGPGATGRSHSSFETIIESIEDRLLTLPGETIVHTGHGDSTTIGVEAPHLADWLARGH
ncbi:hydrolase [Acrocarpospora corrugata]|uniref:Hydrolase n=1 Tax=Acrocarpospora corrugata TaxID=35763 RepID=A0A5M3W3D8_9ACTN|nr:MBL fold metallo-hydrolase [Acrocarpospora corrugata]GES03284.1 hydrolase [Acrocarpospora corrugata]